MWQSGTSERKIAAALAEMGEPISHMQVHRIIKRGLKEAREARLDHAELILEGELERLNAIIRHNWGVMTALCRPCEGAGIVPSAIPGVSDPRPIPCEACRGDGKANHPDVRIRASKAAMDAIEKRVRMLGGYEPDRLIIQNPDGTKVFDRSDLESLNMDELDKMLADYEAGVEAGLRLAEMQTERNA
jgi:hypothetical protein